MVLFFLRQEPKDKKPGRDQPDPRRQRRLTEFGKMKAMQQIMGFQMAFGKTKQGMALDKLNKEASSKYAEVIGRKTGIEGENAFEALRDSAIRKDPELRTAFEAFNKTRTNQWEEILKYARGNGAHETTIQLINELIVGLKTHRKNVLG